MNAEIDTCDLKHQKSFDAIQVQEVGNDRQAEELVILSLGGDKFLGEKWRLTRATLQSSYHKGDASMCQTVFASLSLTRRLLLL